MVIQSLRLGSLHVPADKIITMERPILGFEHLKSFCLVEVEEMRPFCWLQSLDDPAVSFAVVNPSLFWPEYRIEINPNEIAELRVHDVASIEAYVVVTFGRRPEQISANLQGPILINNENQSAKQLVLVNSSYEVCHSLLEALDGFVRQVETAEALAIA